MAAIHSAIGYGGQLLLTGTGIAVGTTLIIEDWECSLDIETVEGNAGFGEMFTEAWFGDATWSGTFNYHLKVSTTTAPFKIPTTTTGGWGHATDGMAGTLTLETAESTFDPNVTADSSFSFAVIITRLTFGRSNKRASTGTASFRNSGQVLNAAITAAV